MKLYGDLLVLAIIVCLVAYVAASLQRRNSQTKRERHPDAEWEAHSITRREGTVVGIQRWRKSFPEWLEIDTIPSKDPKFDQRYADAMELARVRAALMNANGG